MDMLGSLVVIYPTVHEGGELVLHHKDREWKLEANSLTALSHPPSLAFVAFYSDIEHEVLKVTSGRRVTVTYNLYLVNPISHLRVAANVKSASNLQTTLHGLLRRPEFLPHGGTLGFGLAHLYPIAFETKLQVITNYLKGEDAHVYRACRGLQLDPLLQMIYDDNESDSGYGIMVDKIVRDPDYDCEAEYYETALLEMGGVSVNKTEDLIFNSSRWVRDDWTEGEHIIWVSPFNNRNQLRDNRTTYGNEVSHEYTYCSPCLIVRIAPASDRV